MVSGGLTPAEDRSAPERPPSPLAAAQMLSVPPVAPVAWWRFLAGLAGWVFAAMAIVLVTWLAPVVPPPLRLLANLRLMLCFMGGVGTCLVLLYKAWAAIQDGKARMTPAAAVLRCLIPVYNVYGLFQAIVGFAYDFNRLAEREGLEGVRARVWLYWTWCLSLWLTLLPLATAVLLSEASAAFGTAISSSVVAPLIVCVNGVAALILPLATALLIVDMCNAINAIADAQADQGTLPA